MQYRSLDNFGGVCIFMRNNVVLSPKIYKRNIKVKNSKVTGIYYIQKFFILAPYCKSISHPILFYYIYVYCKYNLLQGLLP